MLSPTATIGIAQLAKDLQVSIKTVRRMNRTGALPKPGLLNNRAYRWRSSEIIKWLDLGMPNRQEFEKANAGGSMSAATLAFANMAIAASNPANLVAAIIAAKKAGNGQLERLAKDQLFESCGVRLSLGRDFEKKVKATA